MDLSFLSDVKLEAVKKVAPKGKLQTPKLPEKADLRLFANGGIYPSKTFAAKHDLEFIPKTAKEGDDKATIINGNGLEVFSSKEWGMLQGKLPQEVIFCAPVAKSLAKVDMWASTKYDENNQPKASVFTQGINTFAKKRLVPMVTEIYGINWDEVEYVDLTVVEEQVISSENGLYHLPKIVSTGEHKGKADYIRRENITICPLIVSSTQPKVAIDALASDEQPDLDESSEDVNESKEVKDESSGKEDAEKDVENDPDWAKKLGAKSNEKTNKVKDKT